MARRDAKRKDKERRTRRDKILSYFHSRRKAKMGEGTEREVTHPTFWLDSSRDQTRITRTSQKIVLLFH